VSILACLVGFEAGVQTATKVSRHAWSLFDSGTRVPIA
jgi:hypothetical protein